MSAENDSPGSPVGDENRAISPSELDISSITAADANTPAGASLANGMNGQGLKVIGFSEKEESDEDEEEKDDSEEEGETDESDEEDEGFESPVFDLSSIKYDDQGSGTEFTLPVACSQGNLPVAALLWGMYKASGVDPMTKDSEGNNPLHYAVLADDGQVIDFIMQQTGGYADGEKIIDSRNDDQETPIIRAATRGVLNVMKCLIRYGANLGAMDANKNTIVSNSSRRGHLWCLHFILSLCPAEVAKNLLNQHDVDEHSPLDWACYKGHTNVAEYLMYRGLRPEHKDGNGRNCLIWAAKQGQAETAAYLVALGMDPMERDSEGNSAVMFGLTNYELFDAMMISPGAKCKYRAGATMGEGSNFRGGCCGSVVRKRRGGDGGEDLEKGESLSIKVQKCLSGLDNNEADKGVNPTLMRDNPTRTGFLFLFAAIVYSIWAAMVVLPWWANGLIVLVCYRGWTGTANNIKYWEKAMTEREGRVIKMGGLLPKLMKANELAIGFWLGCALAFLSVCVGVVVIKPSFWEGGDVQFSTGEGSDVEGGRWWTSMVLIGEAAQNTPIVFGMCFACIVLMIASWAVLVFVFRDPGVCYSDRNLTYTDLLDEVAKTGSEPDPRKWCTTSLVRKPVRAKFDAPTGLLVARHDHYCIWLDTAVGFGNHRIFMVFVFFQVVAHVLFSVFGWWNLVEFLKQADLAGEVCGMVKVLFGNRGFGLFVMTLCANACTVGLGFLLAQQLWNMGSNITTNERINGKRYPWLQDDTGEKFCNRFDTSSTLANVVEFVWRTKDYRKVFEIPTMRKGVKLTGDCCSDPNCEENENVLRQPLNPHSHGHGGAEHYHNHDHGTQV